jgi:hypothetical protein
MIERPILFSGPMVRAILEGRKTQTRRVVKNLSDPALVDAILPADPAGFWCFQGNTPLVCIDCPYGEVGDRLWVRETFQLPVCFNEKSPCEVGKNCVDSGYRSPWSPIKYAADGDDKFLEMIQDFGGSWGKKRPAIHMPRWASRITLEIAKVRVEKLKDISEVDAKAEGMECVLSDEYCEAEHTSDMLYTYRAGFKDRWNAINGFDSWSTNPLVWVVSFKRVKS